MSPTAYTWSADQLLTSAILIINPGTSKVPNQLSVFIPEIFNLDCLLPSSG